MEIEKKSLVEFLLKAKNSTYAAQGDEASVPPLLEGYRQLEYGDGTIKELSLDEVKNTYVFLRQALSRTQEERPFRGPHSFSDGAYQYFDVNEGDIERFSGKERILQQGKEIYSLQYCGGLIC